MFKVLFILFVIVPIIEIAVLMQIGSWLGVWPTIAIVIITAWLGAKNVKQQGIVTLNSVQEKMATGEMPSEDIVAGLLLLVAGVLLVTPGFVTDIFGLSLLVPAIRKSLIGAVQQGLNVHTVSGASFHHQQSSFEQRSPFEQSSPFESVEKHQSNTIEGEYERKD